MIYALLSKNVANRIYMLLLAKFARMPGFGGCGGVDGDFWEHLVPQPYRHILR